MLELKFNHVNKRGPRWHAPLLYRCALYQFNIGETFVRIATSGWAGLLIVRKLSYKITRIKTKTNESIAATLGRTFTGAAAVIITWLPRTFCNKVTSCDPLCQCKPSTAARWRAMFVFQPRDIPAARRAPTAVKRKVIYKASIVFMFLPDSMYFAFGKCICLLYTHVSVVYLTMNLRIWPPIEHSLFARNFLFTT